MTSAQYLSGQTLTANYTYDADGRRVKRNVGLETEVWQVYGAGGELLAEYAPAGQPNQPQKEYGYRGGELLVTAAPGAAGWGPAPDFYENPLNPNHSGETPIRSRHITELRTAIDALRGQKGLAGYGWEAAAGVGDPVTTDPILEMRTALDQALGAPAGGYAAGLAQWQAIRAVHIQELRERVLGAWQTGGGRIDLRWLVTDQLGTPRMVLDQSGSLTRADGQSAIVRHDYFPFGEEIGAGLGGRTANQGYAGDNVRQKFTGQERDAETGLDYYGARYYASQQGRFTGTDPVIMASERAVDPQQINLYAYARNNPLRFTDPTGEIIDENIDDEYKKIKKNRYKE